MQRNAVLVDENTALKREVEELRAQVFKLSLEREPWRESASCAHANVQP